MNATKQSGQSHLVVDLAVMTIICTIVAVVCAGRSRTVAHRFDDAMVARPMKPMTIDLSRPGKYTTSYYQTYKDACRQSLHVELQEPIASLEELRNRFSTLKGRFKILDDQGKARLVVDMIVEDAYTPGDPFLAIFDPIQIGTYSLVIDIESGTGNPADAQRKVYGRYLLCGIEYLPVYLFGFISGVAALLAGAFTLGIWWLVSRARKRNRRQPEPLTESTDA